MIATLHHINAHRDAPAPRLVVVASPVRRHRPRSATVALFTAGMTPGFVLASAAMAQGGADMVRAALLLAGISALVTVVAAARARQIARRRRQRLRQRAQLRPAASAMVPLRRAA